jgi:hypothetical protein
MAQTIQLGTGTTASGNTTASPVNAYYAYMHYQTIYTAAELNAAGITGPHNLTSLAYYVTVAPAGGLTNFNLSIGGTALTSITAAPTDPVTVVYSNSTPTWTINTWNTLTFSTPYYWNGTDNLLVDVCHGPDPYISPYGRLYTYSAANGSAYNRADPASTCSSAVTSGQNTKPQVKLTFTAPPACLPPGGLVISNITTVGADLTWGATTAATYNYEIRTSGAAGSGASGLATSGSISGTTTPIAGLNPATNYVAYVQGDCGAGGLSTWSTGVSFHTACTNPAPPYSEDFESTPNLSIPLCMTNETVSGNPWTVNNNLTAYTSKAAISYYNSTQAKNNWIFTQGLTLTGGTSYRLSYLYGSNGGSYGPEKLEVKYGTDASSATMSTLLADHQMSTSDISVNTVDFTPSVTGIYYIGFHAYSAADLDYILIDNISLSLTPSCADPSGLTVSGISASGASLSWTASASNPINGYQWEVRSGGSPGDPSPAASGTTLAGITTAAASGLSPNTAYTLYVRSDCNGEFSIWASQGFTTLCDIATLPMAEGFEAATMPPPCWSATNVSGLLQAVYSTPGDGIASGPSGNPGDSACVRFLFYDVISGSETLSSVPFNPTPANYRVRFDAAGAAYTATIDSVYLESSADGGATWGIVQAMSNEDGGGVLNTAGTTTSGYVPVAADWTTLDYPLPTGTNMVRFRPVSGYGNYVYIDNVVVEETPSCLPPTALSINVPNMNSADLSWTASSSNPGNGYQWEVRSSGNPGDPSPDASGTTSAGVTTATASGLAANTTYSLYVRSDCDGTFSTWTQKTFFTGYCQATGSNSAYLIANFSTSGGFQNISNNNSGFSANGYGDFTSMVASQMAGGSLNFSSDFGGDTYLFSVWVDWNNDLDFDDAGEQLFLSGAYEASSSGTLTVPVGQPDGSYRMRIRTDWLNDPLPCGTGTYTGETEDYTFTVETPTCFAPTVVISSLAGGSGVFTWTNNGSLSYDWELRHDALAPGSPGALASGNVTAGPVTVPGLMMDSTYTFYVRGICGVGDTSYWAATSVFVNYCAGGATANSTILLIGRVAFSDVDNSSGSSAGYEDFTSVVGNVQAGAFYPITIDVTQGYDADRVQVWIDANQDLLFTPDERVFIGYNPANPDPPMDYSINGNFYVSSAALGGTTRMRVRLDNTINGPNPDPCGNSLFGQVEDYTLNVTPPPCAPPVASTSIIPDCGNFQFSVNVDVTSLGDGTSVTVTDNQGSPAQTGATGTYTFGPYFNGTQVTYQVSFGPEPLCDAYVSTTYACTPSNQDCATAAPVTVSPLGSCNVIYGSTIGAATEPMTGSGCINDAISLPAVYYSFVATGFAHYVHVAGLNEGTTFNASVFDGCNGAELSCQFNPDSSLVSGLVAGNTYIVRVVSLDGANFEICITESGIEPVPNDSCSNATAVAVQAYGACTPTSGTLLGATGSSEANPGCVNPALGLIDVFYSFVANGDRQIITMTQDSTDLVYFLSAYDGCGGTELSCALIGPGFDAPGTEYNLSGLTAGNTYYVRVASRSAEGGPFSLCVMDPQPPTEILCGGPATSVTYCMTGEEDHQWAYHSNGTGAFSLTFNSGLIDDFTYHQLIVYDGPDASSPVLFQNEAFPNDPTDLTGITVTASGSDLFMTLVTDGFYLYDPCFSWTVQCAYHPDMACDANPIECGNNYVGLTTGLGNHLPASACPFNGLASTGGTEWFVYTATSDQAVTLSTCGASDFDTRISVFSGADCNNLSCMALDDDYLGCSGGSSQVTFNTTTGNSYWIAVTGAGAAEGSYTLSVLCGPVCTPPANDQCGQSTVLSNNLADGSGIPAMYTTVCATVDAPTSCSGALPVQGVWFTFNSGNYDHALLTLLDNSDDGQYTAPLLDYNRFNGACGDLGAGGSIGCATDAAGVHVMNVVPNTEYHLLVYNTGGAGVAGSFGLMVEHPAHSDASITAILNPLATSAVHPWHRRLPCLTMGTTT